MLRRKFHASAMPPAKDALWKYTIGSAILIAALGCSSDGARLPTSTPTVSSADAFGAAVHDGGSIGQTSDDSFRAVVMAWDDECPTGAPTPCLTLILKGYPVLVLATTHIQDNTAGRVQLSFEEFKAHLSEADSAEQPVLLKGRAELLDDGSSDELFAATEIEIIEFTGTDPAPTTTVREINENFDAFNGRTVTLRGDLTVQFDSDDFIFNDGTGEILAEVESNPPLNRTMFLTGKIEGGGCKFVPGETNQRCFTAEIEASSFQVTE